jgi:hypothetical protein
MNLNSQPAPTSGGLSLVGRIASLQDVPEDALQLRLSVGDADIAWLSAEDLGQGAIPLEEAAALLQNAKRMLRATATTAQRTRSHIAGNFAPGGDEIASQMKVAHTRRGSFVIPLVMPIAVSAAKSDIEEPLPGVTSRLREPAERRVVRTFAESLTAIAQRIVEPAIQPRAGEIAGLVAAGVSREELLALLHVLETPNVNRFSAKFDWSDAYVPPATPKREIVVPNEASELIATAARLMKQRRPDSHELFSGPVIQIRHQPNDTFGSLTLQTLRRGNQVEIEVRRSARDLDAAHEWMRGAETVVVEGTISSGLGQRLAVDKAVAVYPLSESFLPAGS